MKEINRYLLAGEILCGESEEMVQSDKHRGMKANKSSNHGHKKESCNSKISIRDMEQDKNGEQSEVKKPARMRGSERAKRMHTRKKRRMSSSKATRRGRETCVLDNSECTRCTPSYRLLPMEVNVSFQKSDVTNFKSSRIALFLNLFPYFIVIV